MSFKEKANSRLIKMRDTMQGYYKKKDEEKKKRMSLIKQYFYSITSFEKYTEFSYLISMPKFHLLPEKIKNKAL